MKSRTLNLASKIVLPMTLLCMAAVSFSVSADDSAKKRQLENLDLDKDGYMTREEAEVDQMVMEQFDILDVDADGRLDESEFMALDDGASKKTSPILGAEDFAALDIDGNGMISRDEMKMNVDLEKEFDEMDENKDESVDQNEADAFSKKRNNTAN